MFVFFILKYSSASRWFLIKVNRFNEYIYISNYFIVFRFILAGYRCIHAFLFISTFLLCFNYINSTLLIFTLPVLHVNTLFLKKEITKIFYFYFQLIIFTLFVLLFNYLYIFLLLMNYF